jgi:hypothetical protein
MAATDGVFAMRLATRGDPVTGANGVKTTQRCGTASATRMHLQTPVPPIPPEVPPISPTPPIEPPDPVSPPMEPPVPDMPPIGDPPSGPAQPRAASRAGLSILRTTTLHRRSANMRNH